MMDRYGRGVPADWPALLARESEHTAAALEALRGTLLYLSRRNARERVLPELPLLHRGVALLGPEAVRPLLPRLDAAFKAELEAAADVVEIASAANLVACAGERLPAGATGFARALDDLATRKRSLSLQLLQTMALAAIAAGEPGRVPGLVGGGRLARRVRAGEAFGLDAVRFIRYLASAAASGAHPDGIEPAWQSFLAAFPAKLAVRSLHWRDLLWAARGVRAVVGGGEVATVAAALQRDIAACVAAPAKASAS